VAYKSDQLYRDMQNVLTDLISQCKTDK